MSRALPLAQVTALIALAVLLQACYGASDHLRRVPEDGFDQTLNYQFQAHVQSDSDGNCKSLVVRVRALNKMYAKGQPPPRLHLYDDDCMSPVRFERVQFISKDTGEQVQLSGRDVTQFFSEFVRMEGELKGWLWREGVI